jgi:hypothetical protein
MSAKKKTAKKFRSSVARQAIALPQWSRAGVIEACPHQFRIGHPPR